MVNLSNLQLNKLKWGINNGTEVTLKMPSNVVRDSNDENKFPCKSLLNNTQVLRLWKAFVNCSSASIKLSKYQLHKIGQLGGFLVRHLGPLLITGFPLIRRVLNPQLKVF